MIKSMHMELVESDQLLKGWALSLAVHLIIVGAALTAMPRMTILLEQEPFKWEVALIEPSREPVREEARPAPAKVPPQKHAPVEPLHSVEPPPDMTTRVAPQQSPHMLHPVIEQPKPQPPIEPVQRIVRADPKPVEPEPVKREEIKEPAPVVKEVTPVVEPVAPAYTYQAPAVAAHQPAVEHREAHAASAASLSTAEPVASSTAPSPSAAASEPVAAAPAPIPQEAAPVAASAPAPRAATRADYAWLAESLGRRIAALTRYPSTARMNGWEGRVVLRAVIRADGHLADVTVQKSSGYDALDRAALETIRLACPLHMKHQLSTTEVAVNVPIVYSLSN